MEYLWLFSKVVERWSSGMRSSGVKQWNRAIELGAVHGGEQSSGAVECGAVK